MAKIQEIWKGLSLRWGNKEKHGPPLEDLLDNPEAIYNHSSAFYENSDLVYFKNAKVYAAFKYNVVKDILVSKEAIGVSDVHLDLNGVYFSLDEKKHQHNKRAAIRHLGFLSKGLRNSENDFTQYLFEYFLSKFPVESTLNLVDYLINPLVFINILEEYGFLEFMPEFNPQSPAFVPAEAIQKIKNIFEDSTIIEPMLQSYLDHSGTVPETMQLLTDDINVDKDIRKEQLPRFFASMIFAATHSTSSFISSLVHVVSKNYPELLTDKPDKTLQYAVVNEVLRIYTPVPYIFRTVRKDVVYAGKNLKVGDTVILCIGAANLDPKYFPNPRKIVMNRTEKHLAFGKGQYACIGQFATFRMAMNFLSYLSAHKNRITFLNNTETHTLHNAMMKIAVPVKVNI